ncbi:YihY/virulence factor BrkB family protein [Bacillus suaedaesalsae]|uniref:YihY/virulence factor BrkB family protein n=1 Tax=Bacillus suaedaesalsae TaxID=2810349 RepID=A0ABS2DDG2_9BACI|nr:YihY/virulence factor BrkB family protein [Bacillus suaedaesalsae]MBM6616492.1 YihY/virulence factor BrkB family protein [Bacillus suaedaesalsae]
MFKDKPLLIELWKRFKNDEVAGLSAELAYFFLLSLFPFLIFLITLIGYLPLSQDDLLGMINQYAPGESMKIIQTTLEGIVQKQNGGLLSFGIIFTIWSASNGLNAVIRAFNRAYDVKETRHFLVARLMSVLLTIAMIIVIVIALLLPVFGQKIGVFVFSAFGLSETFLAIWNAARWIGSFVILFIVFSCLYYFAPNKHLHWKEVFTGAFFATLGWILVSTGFSYYVGTFGNYSATYGSLGGIIVLMIWFYLSGMIILLGGELNASLNCFREKNTE